MKKECLPVFWIIALPFTLSFRINHVAGWNRVVAGLEAEIINMVTRKFLRILTNYF